VGCIFLCASALFVSHRLTNVVFNPSKLLEWFVRKNSFLKKKEKNDDPHLKHGPKIRCYWLKVTLFSISSSPVNVQFFFLCSMYTSKFCFTCPFPRQKPNSACVVLLKKKINTNSMCKPKLRYSASKYKTIICFLGICM
jgi:hypothetical protein